MTPSTQDKDSRSKQRNNSFNKQPRQLSLDPLNLLIYIGQKYKDKERYIIYTRPKLSVLQPIVKCKPTSYKLKAANETRTDTYSKRKNHTYQSYQLLHNLSGYYKTTSGTINLQSLFKNELGLFIIIIALCEVCFL